VRGVMSKEASGPVLYMNDEQVDWQYGEEVYQPLPFPGAYNIPGTSSCSARSRMPTPCQGRILRWLNLTG